MKLIKKLVIYWFSQSDLLLNNGANITNLSYKILGKGFTNTIIENTGGDIFTSGPDLKTLTKDSDYFWRKHHVESVGNYVMEGIEGDQPHLFNKARDDMIKALNSYCTIVRPFTHLAIKLTGLGDMEMFKVWSFAQRYLIENVFWSNNSN